MDSSRDIACTIEPESDLTSRTQVYKAPVLVLRGLWYKHINIVDMKRKTYERNDVETIIDSDRIL